MNIIDQKTLLDLPIYYDDRYRAGYMEKWDEVKVSIIRTILRKTKMVETATIIDYGCGSGFFTRIIKEEFPKGRVIGVDISSNALRIAKSRSNNIEYYLLNNINDYVKTSSCNFIFSHHVLEHVYDLENTASSMQQLLAPGGFMLHVLPCANPGSFEYKINKMYNDKIAYKKEDRFFFEDPSHLRRLSTRDMVKLFAKQDVSLLEEYYTNQYWGSLKWITETTPAAIKNIFAPDRVSGRRKLIVILYRYMALTVRQMRFSLHFDWRLTIEKIATQRTWLERGRRVLHLGLAAIFYIPSRIVDRICLNIAWKEWNIFKNDPRGGEMILIFQKNYVTSSAEKC